MLATGEVAFCHLLSTEIYEGKDTNKWSISLTLSDEDAKSLQAAGIKLRTYEGKSQRKFSSKYPVKVVDLEDQPFVGDITRGSKVRVQYKQGPEHPVHGVSTYLQKARVLELAEDTSGNEEGF